MTQVGRRGQRAPGRGGGEGRERGRKQELDNAHLIAEPLHIIHDIEATMDDKWIHVACFRAEAGNAIAALFGGAEFEFE